MAFTQAQFSTLKTWAQNRLANTGFYADAEVGIYINEAIRMWQLLTWQWHGSATFVTTLGAVPNTGRYYTISASILKPLRVTFNYDVLDPTSFTSLDQASPGWENAATGVPQSWFPVGHTQIGIHPLDATGSQLLTVYGLVPAQVLVNDTDSIDIGLWQIRALLDYVQHVATFKQGGLEFENSMKLFKSFIYAAGEQNRKFQASALYRRYMGMDLDTQLRPTKASGKQAVA